MNKTMAAMMKPVNPATVNANSKETKLAQERAVLAILENSPYSMDCHDVGEHININSFPGYDADRWEWMPLRARSSKMASLVLRRLEAKGAIVSTLYQGYRLYSIPVAMKGGEN